MLATETLRPYVSLWNEEGYAYVCRNVILQVSVPMIYFYRFYLKMNKPN